MVSILHLLRVFIPFDVRNGLSAMQVRYELSMAFSGDSRLLVFDEQDFCLTDASVQAKLFPEPVVNAMYRAPKVKFMDEPTPPPLALAIPKPSNTPTSR